MNLLSLLTRCACACLLLPATLCGGGAPPDSPAPAPPNHSTLLPVEPPAPIDISADGQLLLLFLPGGQGFELVDTATGQREIVSSTPNSGYFATLSPDKKYVCFKDFKPANGRLLQVPVLYDIARKKQISLAGPALTAGNPVVSARGQIAFSLGEQLIVLNSDLSLCLETSLGFAANVLAFSPDGRRLAFSDPEEAVSWIDLDTGKVGAPPAGELRGHQPRFSPDGQGLLARRANGDITACRAGLSRNLGYAAAAAWLDDDTIALVSKDVANFTVTQTRVLKCKLADGSTSTLLTKPGNTTIALNAFAMALNAEDGVSLADPRTGLLRKLALAAQPVPTPAYKVEPAPAPAVAAPNIVTTNGATVQLSPVPYVNQVYDTADDFAGGYSACNATATIMAIQYHNRLPPRPITCTRGGTHTSNYGYYISKKYSFNGVVFDIPSSDSWGADLAGYYGGFGCFLQDDPGTSLQRSIRLKEWIIGHGLTSATDDSATIAEARAEINANHPIVVLNDLTTSGHYITCIGYIQGQHTLIFNDPYGNKNISYPGKQGAGAIYDWPGYNNGYQNLNAVYRYIYARGTVAANTNWGSYWDLNAATAGAGAAPAGTWNSTTANWSSSANGTVATGPWAEQNAIFAAGTDAAGAYTVSVSGTQMVANVLVQEGAVTFTGGRFYFLGSGTYYSNYVAAGATAIYNTPFGGTAAPDKWGPGTTVYNGASTCGGYFSHNDGTLALGHNSALSNIRLEVGDQTGAKVVTLQAADATARTLANYLVLKAANLNIGPGGNLTFTGPINVNSNAKPARVIAVSNSVTTFSGVLTNTCGLTKTGPGTLLLSGGSANTYGSATANGYTTVNAGTLKLGKTAGVAAVANGSLILNSGGTLLLGAANQIGNAIPLTLAGGTFQTAGFSEQLGALKLTATSVVDLGASASVLAFAASSAEAWTPAAILTITNWNGSITGGGPERVLFGGSSAGLTSAQVGQIRFANPPGFLPGNYAATMLSTGEVVPATAPPGITAQPASQVAVAGESVSFTVAATGTPAPAYQWRVNGANLAGATVSSLSLPGVTLGHAGTYSVVITNLAGSTSSANAVLAVYASAIPALTDAACSTDGCFQMNLSGVPGCRYAILASTDLTNWTVLQTNTSPFTFTDTNSAAPPRRFYRAQYLGAGGP